MVRNNGVKWRTFPQNQQTGTTINQTYVFVFFFFVDFRLSNYGTASTENAVFIFGGWNGDDFLSEITKFEADEWNKAGELHQARGYHSVISLGSSKMIIGGQSSNVEP